MINGSGENKYSFEISLSILNHLGRNLYRSFVTVLGEAVSNSWDADAENVYIYIDRVKNILLVKDDGKGMSSDEFQQKFLRIGYSKRNQGNNISSGGRPFIGRKGIGKLALLSCASRISVISKKKDNKYIGGTIDNRELDNAIKDDLNPNQYSLGEHNINEFEDHTANHEKGTIILFDEIYDGVRKSPEYLKKAIAMYFRFSILDSGFKIFVNNEEVTIEALNPLLRKSEFLWQIGDVKSDEFITKLIEGNTIKEKRQITLTGMNIRGFIASVEKPRDLKIITTEEKVGVDLFVNGRLREKDILKHISTARVVESYLYGQIHYDELDDSEDRFTSSREGIIADDPKYKNLLMILRDQVIKSVLSDWDSWRIKHREDGDSENDSISLPERKSGELFSSVVASYGLNEGDMASKKVNAWVADLASDAKFNFASYAECFISENLIRKYIYEKRINLSPEANDEVKRWKDRETKSKNAGNISIEIRKESSDLSYLSMDGLANLVDKPKPDKGEATLSRDAKEYKPMRDSLAHTALLTDEAKARLSAVFNNIKQRVINILKYTV